MASPLAVNDTFQLSVGGQQATFKVDTVTGDNFTAKLQADVSGAFGADLKADLTATYSAANQTIALTGKALYQRFEMDFVATYDISNGSSFQQKVSQAVLKDNSQPTLTIGISSLFGDTGSLLKDVNVSGGYNTTSQAYDWSGNVQVDFTPEDATNNDEITASLSNLAFGQDANNANKGFLQSATLTLSQGGGNTFALGGVSIVPKSLSVSYTDDRLTAVNNQYKKSFGLTLVGSAEWGKETTSKDDDFTLGLDGSGTYAQIYTTAQIQGNATTNTASFTNPVKISGGLTAFAATVTGDGSIDLGPLTLLPKQAAISYAADLDKKYALWNLGGSLGLQAGFLPDVTLSLGDANTTATTGLATILGVQDVNTYPTAGGWSLGAASAALAGTDGKPLVDLGLVSVDGVQLSLTKTGTPTGPDLSALGFYKFINNNTAQPTTTPTTLTQDAGKSIKLDVTGVKLNSSTLVNALKGTTDTISEVLSPVRPLVDFFTQQVTVFDGIDQALRDPIVSFLESTPNNKYADGKVQAVEFVDSALAAKALLAGQTPTSITPAVKAAENVFTVLDAVSNLADQSAKDGAISLGDFSFSYPLNKLKPQPATAATAADSATATTTNAPATPPPTLADFRTGGKIANQIAATPNPNAPTPGQGVKPLFTSNTAISFPVLSDPIGYVTRYFSEGSADLFTVDIDFGFAQTFDVSVPIPAFPVVKVGIQGGVDASLKTSIASSLDAAALTRLKNDFSVTTLGAEILKGTGIDLAKTQAQFGANLGLSVGVDAYIASLTLVGGLEGRLTIQPVLMEKEGQKAASQVLKLGGDGGSIAKPAFVQAGVKLKQLKLEIEQNLDNVISTGLSKEQAYSKNTWLLSIMFDQPQDLASSVATKLGNGFVLDRLRLIEIDNQVMLAATTDYRKLSIDLAGLREENAAIYKAALSALKDQLKADLPVDRYNSLTDTDYKELMRAIRNTAPRSIEYATIDASVKGLNTAYSQRKEFLQKNLAFEVIDGTAAVANAKAVKQAVTYYPAANQTTSTSNFYQLATAALNQGAKASDPEWLIKVNGKLNQSFNSVSLDLLPTSVAAATSITIKAQDASGSWQSIGVLSRAAGSGSAPASFSLTSALDEKAAELLLISPKDSDVNKANYKLVLNLSNQNKSKSNALTQSIIEKASNGTLQLAFDVTSGSAQAVALSDPRIVQGGAVSVGLESSATTSKLLTNALGNLDDNGKLTNDQLREFAIVGQPTDILNPAEWSYSRTAFGGIPETVVELSNYGLNYTSNNQAMNRYDSLAVVNAVNRVAINDSLSADVKVKTGTSTRQTVDPISGDTFLSYIDATSGNLAVAKRAANSTIFQAIKIFKPTESGLISYQNVAPDLVAYNGKIMGAAKATASGKLARFLLTNSGDIKEPIYKLEIDATAELIGSTVGPVRLGLIAERDASSSSSSNELTVAFAYTSDSVDPGNVIVQRNKNLQSSNIAQSSQTINLDLSSGFANWSGEKAAYFGDSVVDVDFMEFGAHADIRSHLSTKNASTIFSLEGTSGNLKIWNAASTEARKYQYPLNLPGMTPTSLSVVYSKQAAVNEAVPSFINNWKGTSPSVDRNTDWKSDGTIEKNLAIVVTGTVSGDPQNSFKNGLTNNTSYSGLSYNEQTLTHEGGSHDVAYLYSPYADMYTANAASLRLATYTTADSPVAQQNVNNAKGGLAWTWYPMLGKANNMNSNVQTNINAGTDGYLALGASSVVALDEAQPGSVMADLRTAATNGFLQLSKNSFQIVPRSGGSYALSGMSTGGMIVSVDQVPNYETGLLTTKTAFNTPENPAKLIKGYFDGTSSFVNQGEWAPLGIASTADGVYLGDLRDPVKYSRPQDQYAAPSAFSAARSSIDVGQSVYTYSSDPSVILEPGHQLSSPNGKYTLDMQLDGELILYENTLSGRTVLFNVNDFIYETGRQNIVGGYSQVFAGKRAVKGTKLGLKSNAVTKSDKTPNGVYLCLIVPTQEGGSDYKYIPLNPDQRAADNINYIFPQKDGGQNELNYDWRQRADGWGVTVYNVNDGNQTFNRLVLDNNGNLVAYDYDSSDPEMLFYLKNWRASQYSSDNSAVTSLTNSTPFGFNGLVSDIVKEAKVNTTNSSLDPAVWNGLMSGSGSVPSGYDIVNVSPDLNSRSSYIPAAQVRDVVLSGTGGFSALLAKRDGTFTQLSDAITWGRSAPPANQLKSLRFLTPIGEKEGSPTISKFVEDVWTNASTNQKSAEFELLNAAVPVAGKATWNDWLATFESTYSSLRALSVLPAVSSRSYFSVPTIELTPRTADLGEVYKTYAAQVSSDKPYISIDTNFKLDAFVKVVASFAWWSSELLKATFPILDETWSFKTGYGAGGPVYGTQQIHLDQDHDLIADNAEISSINADAAFSLDLSPLAESLRLAPDSPRNTIWNGTGYVFSPPTEGIDFRSGLLVVQPSAHDSVFDTATGLANNKVYISVPDSEYLVANIWTSLKYSPVLDYHFFSQDATAAATADFYAESKLRYSSDPYFVTKLTPAALEGVLNRRLAGIPAAYSTSAGDTFDAYNGIVAADPAVAAQAFAAFRFTSRLTLVLETVERLLNRLKADTAHWGQADSYADRRSLISSYQLIPYLAMAAEGRLDSHYTQVLRLAAQGQSAILSALDAGTFQLDLSKTEHVQLLLTFAALTVPNGLGQASSPFSTDGRLNLADPALSSWLAALKLDAVATSLTNLTTAYDTTAQRFYEADRRLLTAALAPIKRDALKADGLIDAILQSSLPASAANGFTTILDDLLKSSVDQRVEIKDTTRIASITEALEFDVDANGAPVQHQALRISLNHAAPPGGTIVPLTYSGTATYGAEYKFEGNAVQPKYVFVPFGETSVVIPVTVLPQQQPKDWTLAVGIQDPSSSYHVSADINKVFLRYRAEAGKLSLYDNNVLVRLSDDAMEPHKLMSANPEDMSFDYDFYRNSRVVGVEAVGDTARTLQYFVNSENPAISIYAIAEPPAHPTKPGSWILVGDDVMQVYAGAEGDVDIAQYFNAETGVYGYAPATEVDHAYQGSAWQNQGIVFSLRPFNREIAEAIGTITPVSSVGTSFAAVSERSPLPATALARIKELGLAADQINANSLRLRPQLAAHQKGRASVVLDLASVADRTWDPGQGLPGRFVSSFRVNSDGSVRDASYNATSGSGARFYSLHSSSGSLDTVVLDVADGVDDADGQANQVDATTATAFAVAFAPKLQGTTDGAVQFLDASQDKTPLVGGVQVSLQARGRAVQDLRYTVLAQGETVADLRKLSPDALEARSRLLISSLENADVTPLPSEASGGSAFSQTIPLTNGQKLVLLERSGRDASGAYQPVQAVDTSAANSQTLTTPGGLSLKLEASTSVNRLPEFLSRDQQQAPVLNFTGLDGQAVGFDVEVAREADYSSSLGFYRVIDSQGSVRDSVSGAVITPGDPGYAKAALAEANRPNLRSFSVADNAADTFKSLRVQEAALLAPYGQLADGTTLFAFAAANPDNRSHFSVLGQNILGFEDLLSRVSDFDYDDMVIAVRNPSLG